MHRGIQSYYGGLFAKGVNYMKSILVLDKIPQVGLNLLGGQYIVGSDVSEPAGVLIRSSPLMEGGLPESVLTVSRAGSGVNHIPCKALADAGIVVMNTPGANANAVTEAVIAAMLILSRRMYEAIGWVASLNPDDDISGLAEKKRPNLEEGN